jgi:O-antigen ligase/tetratricopeptide (TPR) repeat protein
MSSVSGTTLDRAVDRPAAPAARAGTRSAPPGRLAAWVGIVILTLYMTLGHGSGWYGLYAVELRIFTLLSIAIVFSIWAIVAWRNAAWRPRTVLWPAILAVLVAFAISTALSWSPRISLEYFAYAVLLAGLYLLLVRLIASDFFRPRLYALAALILLTICAWYTWQVGNIWVEWWQLVGRVALPPPLRPGLEGLTWGSPNTVAIMVVLLLPPVLAFFWTGASRRALVLGLLAAFTALTVLLSGSRGAWLGLAIAVGVTGLVWIALPSNRRWLRDRWPRSTGARLVLGLVGVGIVVVGLLLAPLALSRLSGGGEQLRADLAANALRQFATDPLSGTGPGTWVVQRIPFTEPPEQDYYIPHAHNVFLQGLSEFGLVGLVAGIVLGIWLFWLIADGMRDPDARRRRFGWAALFAATYYGAHQLVDLYVGVPCTLFALALSVGYLDATARRSLTVGVLNGARAARSRAIATGAFVVLVVGAFGFLGWSEANALPAGQAVGEANALDWTAALRSARAAESADPGIPLYSFLVGLGAAHTGDAALAAASFERSARADGFPHAWLNAAAVRLELGDVETARADLREALRIGRQQAPVDVAASELAARLGDVDQAVDLLSSAFLTAPSLATDPTWELGAASAARRDAAVDLALERTPGDWSIALQAGRLEEARARVAALDPTDRGRPALILSAWQGDSNARASLEDALRASPMDGDLLVWNARLAKRSGDERAFANYLQWAKILVPLGVGSLQDLRFAQDANKTNLAGVDPNVYGLYGYRRPTPVDLFAPELPHLELE